jgi:membrane-anchored protein YejM (alkaline phosphatase superfamily)
MPIVLSEDTIIAKTSKHGAEFMEVPAEHWLHYEYGTPEAPVQVLIAQVPAGKKWKVTMSVYIEETDA